MYFFSYKTEFLPFQIQNNPNDLDLSCKTDLDLCDFFRRGKPILIVELEIYVENIVEKGRNCP